MHDLAGFASGCKAVHIHVLHVCWTNLRCEVAIVLAFLLGQSHEAQLQSAHMRNSLWRCAGHALPTASPHAPLKRCRVCTVTRPARPACSASAAAPSRSRHPSAQAGAERGRARSGGVGGGQLARVGDDDLLGRRAAGRADLPAARWLTARPEVQADAGCRRQAWGPGVTFSTAYTTSRPSRTAAGAHRARERRGVAGRARCRPARQMHHTR